jgi:sulfur-oxidizing protein SoxY
VANNETPLFRVSPVSGWQRGQTHQLTIQGDVAMGDIKSTHTRRDFIVTAAGAAAFVIAPGAAMAEPADVAAAIAKAFGDKKATEGKIKLDLPSIAENGLVVPLNFEVESPMTEKDYVKAVHLYAEGNPNPAIADYTFSPMSPKAAASIRIRLAKTQNIIAVAEMSNGELYTTKKEVKVTIGGCGG